MKRRITAALMALIIIFIMPAFLVKADAATVYEIGDEVWVLGMETVPKAPEYPVAEGGRWSRVYRSDGSMDSRTGKCPIEEHAHDFSCYSSEPENCGNPDHTHQQNCYLNCGKEEHSHQSVQCRLNLIKYYQEYHWKVISVDAENPPTLEDPTAPTDPTEETPTDPTEDPTPASAYNLYVRSQDISGNPITGAEFLLCVTDPQMGDVLVTSGKTKDTEDHGVVATLNYAEYVATHDMTKDSVLYLVQQAFSGSLANEYREISEKYYIVIGADANGKIGVKGVSTTEPTVDQESGKASWVDNVSNFNADSATLTVVNQPWTGSIFIDIITLGFAGKAPDQVTSTLTLSCPGSTKYDFEITSPGFYLSKDVIESSYGTYAGMFDIGVTLTQKNLENISMGEYSISVTDPVEIPGYTAKDPVIQVRCPIHEAPQNGNTATLVRGRSALFTVIYEYVPEEPTTEPTDPTDPTDPITDPTDPTTKPSTDPTTPTGGNNSGTSNNTAEGTSNTVIVKVEDEQGQTLDNCEIGLYSGKKLLKKWVPSYNGTFVLDDLEELAGEDATYVLKQTKAAAGYQISDDSFKVTVTTKGDDVRVEVKKKAGSLSELLKKSNVEIGTDGKQIATFVNQRKTTLLELSCKVNTEFAQGAWRDESLVKDAQENTYEFLLTWENAAGEQQEERVLLSHGESEVLKAELPFGTDYTISAVQAEGPFQATFSDNYQGTVGTEALEGNILVEAVQTYTVKPGQPLTLSLIKVDANTKLPLTGVKFVLKDPAGKEVKTYVSGEEGELELVDVLTAPGTYALEEIKTLDGYKLLTSPVKLDVAVEYTADAEQSASGVIQTMTVSIADGRVVAESDGSYWIENEPVEAEEEKSGGLGTGAIIGICAAAGVAVAGGATALILTKRKGK